MITFIVSAAIFILDYIVKNKIELLFDPAQSTPLIKNIIHITYVRNTGTAFGLFQGNNIILIFISSICIVFLIAYFYNHCKRSVLLKVVIGCILGGAISNLFDRIRFGYVVDYIDLRIWPVFNISDMCISVGFLILFFLLFYSSNRSDVVKIENRK